MCANPGGHLVTAAGFPGHFRRVLPLRFLIVAACAAGLTTASPIPEAAGQALPAPEGVHARGACQSLIVHWEPVPGAYYYKIRRSGAPDVIAQNPPYVEMTSPTQCRSFEVTAMDYYGVPGLESTSGAYACANSLPPANLMIRPDFYCAA
jgi:hypothetical protein